MASQEFQSEDLISFLKDRKKELNCLYLLENILNQPDISIGDACKGIIETIPTGWQYSDRCKVKITIEKSTFTSPNFSITPWALNSNIQIRDKIAGDISIYYTKESPASDIGPFLESEARLLDTIANRLSHFIIFNFMKQVFEEYDTARKDLVERKTPEWRVVLSLLRQTDKNLFHNISRRMLNHLVWSGYEEANKLLQKYSKFQVADPEGSINDDNVPHQKSNITFSNKLSDDVFLIADKYLKDDLILSYARKWIQEDKISFLVQAVHQDLPIADIAEAVQRYRRIVPDGVELPPNTERGLRVNLVRQFLSSDIEFIKVAKNYINISDYENLLNHIICTSEGKGKLGGKGAGLFLAQQIILNSKEFQDNLGQIKIPKTWYITSNVQMEFVRYNSLNEVVEQKYKDINQVRLEYPHVVQTFKNSHFPTEIIQGLSVALDDFGDKPLVVRSSSLLEDRAGAVFSGKYKSLFLANRGSKQSRLVALLDAIAEVYASVFGPDPIEYRAERGLLDFSEEMGIMIQEVVGNKVGNYFFPSYAGVAFSRNEFRWSPRIKREDGLIRLVMGLGTRAVDRIGDDYPVLVAPGQPGLRVNASTEEVIRYSPRKADVINLRSRTFETIDLNYLLKIEGNNIPGIEKQISIYQDKMLRRPMGLHIDFEKDNALVTFDGLITNTNFVKKIKTMVELLEKETGKPVDLEFASDGKDFYLLQCRPQSYVEVDAPAMIPSDITNEQLIFSANKFVSNGQISDITHIVYVDPESYDSLSEHTSLTAVGRAVGKLNKLLPKRKFILMGPGRWGSRGDIKLGVRVTYSEINNTAALIEMARQKGKYVPDLSFGTHFFQDLVEADIKYLPLYPDNDNVAFNEKFFKNSNNILEEVLPEFAHLSDTIKVIDIPGNNNGNILQLLMNADLDEAVAILTEPTVEAIPFKKTRQKLTKTKVNHWAWRMRMAENMVSMMDPERFGVEGIYLFGSTKNATANADSDINLIVHFTGTTKQKHELDNWFEGWSLCLDEMNFLSAGARIGGLLNIVYISDEDIKNQTSYAAKLGKTVDPPKQLTMLKA